MWACDVPRCDVWRSIVTSGNSASAATSRWALCSGEFGGGFGIRVGDLPNHWQHAAFHRQTTRHMDATPRELKNGDHCKVVGGTHAGKSGTVADLHMSRTGHITITVVQANGERFKTLGKNVVGQ